MFSGAVFAPLSGAAPGSPLRHSAKRCATSPAGGAKCTCVNRGKVCGKEKPKKLRLTTKFSSVHGRKLGSPSGRAGAKRLRGEQKGAPALSVMSLRSMPPLPHAGEAKRNL